MNIIRIALLILLGFSQGYAQSNAYLKKQFRVHYNSIKKEKLDKVRPLYKKKLPAYFIDCVVDKVSKENPELKYHITNRYLLKYGRMLICTDSTAYLCFSEKNSHVPKIYVIFEKETAAGGIERLKDITVAGPQYRGLVIPDSAYAGIYDPNFCRACYPIRTVESFLSKNNKFLYIYVYGLRDKANDCREYIGVDLINYIVKYVVKLEPTPVYLGRIFIPFSIVKSYNLYGGVELGF